MSGKQNINVHEQLHAHFITGLLLAVNFIISLLSTTELRNICHKQFPQLHALFVCVQCHCHLMFAINCDQFTK